QHVVLVEHRDQTADAARDDRRQTLGRHAGLTGVPPGLQRGDQRKLLAAVEAAKPGRWQDRRRIGSGGCREPHRQKGGPLLVQKLRPRVAGEQAAPGGRDVTAERSGGSEAGDDDLAVRHAGTPAFSMYVTTSATVFSVLRSESGIEMWNRSSAIVAISTIDSESMSRSSVNDASATTRVAGTPVAS